MSKFTYQPKNVSQTPTNQISKSKKRSSSQIKYQKAPDIMTQAKPAYLNNFVQPINPHQSAFTPTNRSKNLEQKKLLLPEKSIEFSNKKTLILDLDETLVHSSFVPFENNDIILSVDFESVMYNIYVLVRPGAEEFIKKVSKYFEVVIFTASIAKYALPLLDILDHEKKIKHRLTREHCTFLNGIYIKELKKLNRNLKDLIIVDNSPLAYAFDSDNGLPIKTWYDDPEDNELNKIFPLLEFLAKTKDVRAYINKFVNNNEINYTIVNEFLKNINDDNKNNNITNDNNKDDNERKAISVNINMNIKNKNKNNDNNIILNNMQNNRNNKNNNKQNNNNKNNNNIRKNSDLNNNTITSLYSNKLFGDKKEILYNNINNSLNTNININNNLIHKNYYKNGKNLKNKSSNIMNISKNSKEKIISTKSNYFVQKKKNSFRIGPKFNEKLSLKNGSTTNNIHLKNGTNIHYINNSKYPINNNDSDFPLGLSLSNTTKNKISKKAQILYSTNQEKNSNQNRSKNKDQYILQKNIFYDKNNTLNYNYINKKYKYTNLLEKLENNTIKSNCTLNNKTQSSKSTKIFNGKNMLQKKKLSNQNKNKNLNHVKVSSSLIGKYQALIINNNSISENNNKLYTTSHVSRSKSTGNFINFSKKVQKPKTPKGQFIFEKKIIVGINKDNNKNNNKKGMNIMDKFSKTTRNINNHQYIINDEIKNNF